MELEGLKDNTLQGLWQWFTEYVSKESNPQEARAMGRLVFEEVFGITPARFALERDMRMSESQIVELWRVIRKLKNQVPLQYILGKAWFRELVLKVDYGVLIPRGETEELVQWVLDDCSLLPQSQPLQIWDVGTGSGCIALSIAYEKTNARVWASDCSEAALSIAMDNAATLGLSVNFFLHDLLNDPLSAQKFHCIVSNPPYVRHQEKPLMQKNVLDHEPHSALFVPDQDPLVFYRALAQAALQLLHPGGALYVEINEALGEPTRKLFEQTGLVETELRQDIHGKDRFVKGVIPQ